METPCCITDKNFKEAELCTKLLSDSNRFHILCLLKNGSKCVTEIKNHLNIPQNLVSFHLKVLTSGGLVKAKRRGHRVYYQRNEERLRDFGEIMHNFLSRKAGKTG